MENVKKGLNSTLQQTSLANPRSFALRPQFIVENA